MRYFKLFLYCSLFACFCSAAKQLSFNKAARGDNYIFDYLWLDQKKQKQSLSFSLPKDAIFERFRSFKVYKSEFAQQSANKSVHEQLKRNRLRGVQVIFPKNKNDSAITIKGPNREKVNEAYNKIADMQVIANEEYLKKNLINIIGGCCGTTPAHIAAITALAAKYQPRKLVASL